MHIRARTLHEHPGSAADMAKRSRQMPSARSPRTTNPSLNKIFDFSSVLDRWHVHSMTTHSRLVSRGLAVLTFLTWDSSPAPRTSIILTEADQTLVGAAEQSSNLLLTLLRPRPQNLKPKPIFLKLVLSAVWKSPHMMDFTKTKV